jgi:signal transduction histidine kinase
LNPELIESFGLIKTLEMEIEKMERPGLININYHVTGNPVFMNSQKELVIFRIIQEAFNNILKHARAKNVLIQLFYNKDEIEVTIQDDGAGFILETLSENRNAKAKSGLLNMKKRAKLIDGSCKIISEPGYGNSIYLSTPY